MTDINPQWRYKAMTEQFGLCGIGWKFEISKLWTEDGANGEKLSFAQVAVFVKDGDKWSEPIVGIGGSRLVTSEKGKLVSNDEGYKMAVTDAFSTALKMLGVAADIYAGLWDGSKYKQAQAQPVSPKPQPVSQPQASSQQPQAQSAKQPVSEKQPLALEKQPVAAGELKGGENTPEESKRLNELLTQKYFSGDCVFTHSEWAMYKDYRKTQYTAKELISFVENALRNRFPACPALPENKNRYPRFN